MDGDGDRGSFLIRHWGRVMDVQVFGHGMAWHGMTGWDLFLFLFVFFKRDKGTQQPTRRSDRKSLFIRSFIHSFIHHVSFFLSSLLFFLFYYILGLRVLRKRLDIDT